MWAKKWKHDLLSPLDLPPSHLRWRVWWENGALLLMTQTIASYERKRCLHSNIMELMVLNFSEPDIDGKKGKVVTYLLRCFWNVLPKPSMKKL